jgi:hypothetical protein
MAKNGDTVSIAKGTYVENVTVSKNVTIAGAGVRNTIVDGGATNSVFVIKTNANVHIKALRIRNGKASEAASGGQGGGISVAVGGTLALDDVSLADNQANAGGGIANYGTLTLKRVILYRNHGVHNSGGGLMNNGTAILDQTDVQLNDATFGAGINNRGSLTITNSAIHGNTAPNGIPGIYNSGGTLALTNVTISGNASSPSSGQGGGISQTTGSTTLNYVTITGNSQAEFGGVFTESGTVITSNSIIYGNGANPQCGSATIGKFSDGNYNVLQDQSCGWWPAPTGKSILANPKLKPLTYSGGFTLTHALEPSSPAIDLVPKDKCIAQDQRGVARPKDGNGDGVAKCDAGAYEYP